MTTEDYASFIGRERSVTLTIDATPADRLTAALDFDDPPFGPGDALPFGWQWMSFVGTVPRASEAGADGRGASGDILPRFDGLNRMWAGGRFDISRPLVIGEAVTRTSRVLAIDAKTGRSGELVVVSLEHTYRSGGSTALVERQDLVYREPKPYSAAPAAGETPKLTAAWQRSLVPDEVLLFRFSALTYNSHRIHYDHRYTTEIERYPGLLVHGPLTAILLLDGVRRHYPRRRLARFEYRAQRPLFVGKAMSVGGAPAANGDDVSLWASDHQGLLAMSASASFG